MSDKEFKYPLHARIRFWLGTNTPNRWQLQSKWMNRIEVPLSKIRLAIHCAWLALSGDQELFEQYESRHTEGIERYKRRNAADKELKALRAALKESDMPTDLMMELGTLREQSRKHKREIRTMQECLERKNLELDIAHFVWCDGNCKGGQHRFCDPKIPLTKSDVEGAIRQTDRLVTRWNNTCRGDEMIKRPTK